MENLGSREYDPGSGRFLSNDPVMEADDPTQLGGYDYAGNDPVSGSDPTGLMLVDPVSGMGFGNVKVLDDWYHDEGYTDSHGHETAKFKRYMAEQNREWDAYYRSDYYKEQSRYDYEPVHHAAPKPKPAQHHSGWSSFLSDAKKVGSFLNTHRTTILSVASIFVPALVPVAMASGAVDAYSDFSNGNYVSGALDVVGVAGGAVGMKLGKAAYESAVAADFLGSATRVEAGLGRGAWHGLLPKVQAVADAGARTARYNTINTWVGVGGTAAYEGGAWERNDGGLPSWW
jgi:hypothetical protein